MTPSPPAARLPISTKPLEFTPDEEIRDDSRRQRQRLCRQVSGMLVREIEFTAKRGEDDRLLLS